MEDKINIIRQLPDSDLEKMISETEWRNFCMKNLFKEYQAGGMSAKEAIDYLSKKYNLEYGSVRNIVYKKKPENSTKNE
jgi:phosphopantetheinyl transferase (holo-ACP synthase)